MWQTYFDGEITSSSIVDSSPVSEELNSFAFFYKKEQNKLVKQIEEKHIQN
jgi:hypothetical protein